MIDTPNGLTFGVLRAANKHRLPQFKDAHGRIVHNADGSDWSVAEWFQAMAGEVGELANLLKKVRRGDFKQHEVQQLIADELADIVTYLDILAMRLEVDLGRAAISKFNRVSERVGATTRILSDGSGYYDT